MERLISWSLANRALVIFLAMLWLAVGLRSLNLLPIDAVPDVTNVQVTVNSEAMGLSPPEVESLITMPVESALLGLPHVEEVRSLSKYGLSQVTVVFEEGTDLYFARQLVGERLVGVGDDFPPGASQPAMGPIATGLSEIYQYELRGDERWDAMELRTLQDWFVKRQLLSVKGVTEVNSFGGLEKQYEVVLDPLRLESLGLDYSELFEVLEQDNRNVGGGFIESRGDQLLVRGLALSQGLDDLRSLVVHTHDGVPVHLGEVAEVRLGGALRQGAVTRDGRGEVVIGIVMMLAGENSRTVSQRVHQRIEELREELPEGVWIDTFYDRTELVERTLHTVSKNLIEGALLVILVLFVFLGDLRAALVVSSVIPFSFLFAATLMLYSGVSGNLMSLGALDFGLIVDGAVVMTEHTVAALALLSGRGSMVQRVERACREMARPMLFGLGIIIAVYLPLLALTGLEGKMFRPMALTVVYALLGSMILSFTLVPVLLSLVLKRPDEGEELKEPWVVRRLAPLYARLLDWVLRHPRLTPALGLLPLLLAGGLASQLGAVFLPELDEGSLAVQAIRIPSVSLTSSLNTAGRVERALREFPEVDSVISKTGRPDLATDPMGIEISDLIITLKPIREWTVSSKEELVSKMRHRLEDLPGINFSFSQPIELRVEELISGSRSDVALQIYGDDLDQLASLGARVVERLQKLPGAHDVALEAMGGVPYLQLEVDRQAAARYGVPPGQILNLISSLLGQQPLSHVLEGERRFPVVATVPEAYKSTPQALTSLKLRTLEGGYVPLGSLVRAGTSEGVAQVNRVNGQRRAIISMNYEGSDLVGFVARAREAVHEVLPPGVVTSWGGEFQNYQRARARLSLLVPLVVAGIVCLLWMSLGRMSWALVIFLNVPFAAVGGVVALALRGMPFSISAAVGFLTLFGVAVLNGLVLMASLQQEQARGEAAWLEAVRGAAQSRLRPVLMTALVASLGFLPMALSHGAGAEVQKPLATVVIGGLVSSTLLTLCLLPGLLSLLPPRREEPSS